MFNQNLKKLVGILSDGNHHSGTDIGEHLSLSRSGVWKLIKQLEQIGMTVIATTNKGYCLPAPLELLDQKIIKRNISKDNLNNIFEFIIDYSLPSTNDFLIDHAKKNKDKNTVCLAEQQTAGRGRLGRQWVSPFGENIYLSLLWHFTDHKTILDGLNIVVGVAVANAIKSISDLPVELKWPNDIYLNDAKAGGVLIDVMSEYNGNSKVIIGIGINLQMSDKAAADINKPWTNLSDKLSRNKLVGSLIDALITSLKIYTVNGISSFFERWNELDYLYNKQIVISITNNQIAGIVKGIDKRGCLILVDSDQVKHSITTGDASVLL